MKYTSTSRLVNVIVFGLILAGFGSLTAFFTFWVDMFYLDGSAEYSQLFNSTYPYNWAANFAFIGAAIFVLACLGLGLSIKALKQGSTDADVTKCFLVYTMMGNVMAFWSLMNAAVFYNLISNGTSVAFWIVLFVIIFLVAMLASNIPMSHLLDEDDGSTIQACYSLSLAAVGFGYLFATLPTCIELLAANTNVWLFRIKFIIYDLCALAVLAFGLLSANFALKKKNGKLPVTLFGLGVAPIGAALIVDASLEYAWRNESKTFSLMTVNGNSYAGLDYVVMAYIVGILLALAAVAIIIVGILPEKKKDPVSRA